MFRVSMEEQRARQQADAGANAGEGQETPAGGQAAAGIY